MDELISLDRSLFVDINFGWSNPVFDAIFPAITDLHRTPAFLAIVVLLCIYWVWKKRQRALAGLLCLVLTIGVTDIITAQTLKPMVDRARPSDTNLPVHLRTHRHSGKSFPSNHAINIFSAATVLSVIFPPAAILWYLIAVAVGISRVYVGVHFPLDVIGGAILGIAIGWLMAKKFLPRLIRIVENRS